MSREIITGIYKITNKINGKCYIGQAQDIYKRWNDHRSCAFNKNHSNHNAVLYRAIRKYGLDNFKFEIIEECSLDKLNEREIYYIDYYNSFIHNKNSNGYNMTLGGEGTRGYKMPNEQKLNLGKHMSEKYTGENNWASKSVICDEMYFSCIKDCAKYYNEDEKNMSNWLSGYRNIPQKYYDLKLHYSDRNFEDHNYEIQHGISGKYHFRSKPVICEEMEFANVRECAEYYCINHSTLASWLNKYNNMPQEWYDKGLHYKGESMDNYKVSKNCRQVICNNKIFDSIKECANYYEVKRGTMQMWLSGIHKMPQKFVDLGLKYYEE